MVGLHSADGIPFSLLGFAFELSSGNVPGDQVPPQGARYLKGCWQADRS
jgi:hypothetical protein